MAKDVVTGGGYGYVIPKVSQDYWQGATPSKYFRQSSATPFQTREEKYAAAEENFREVYKKETGTELPAGTFGIVVIQQGHAPFDFDIAINPKLNNRCEQQAINIPNKVMKGNPYVFSSRTYWLENGKLNSLLDGTSVLSAECCRRAVNKICNYWSAEKMYLGSMMISVGINREHPFRVWRLQHPTGISYLLISLLNGSIFRAAADEFPTGTPAESKFYVGAVKFIADKHENYTRV